MRIPLLTRTIGTLLPPSSVTLASRFFIVRYSRTCQRSHKQKEENQDCGYTDQRGNCFRALATRVVDCHRDNTGDEAGHDQGQDNPAIPHDYPEQRIFTRKDSRSRVHEREKRAQGVHSSVHNQCFLSTVSSDSSVMSASVIVVPLVSM